MSRVLCRHVSRVADVTIVDVYIRNRDVLINSYM
jgi:hypothetical protein